jgi:RND family efflux transporter MFP subunit
MKRRMILPIVILSVMLSGAISGCSSSSEETAATDAKEANLSAVEVDELQPGSIEKTLTYSGKIKENKTVSVTPKTSGRVQEIKVDEGDYVQAGQVLFTIDPSDLNDQIETLEAQLKVGDASLASAQEALSQANDGGQVQTARLQLSAAVDSAKKSVDSAQEGVNNAKVTISTAKSSFDDLTTKYNDYKTMYDAGVISKSDYDAIELGYTQAKNAYEQAQIGLTTSQNQLDQAKIGYDQAVKALEIYDNSTTSDNNASAQKGVDTAVANRDSINVSLAQLKSKLADTVVVAPCSGIVTQKNIEVTNMVSATSAPIVITDTDVVTIDVNISEALVNKVKVGDTVNVTVSSVSSEPKTGTIKTLTGIADATGTYPVEVEIQNEDGSLKPGMVAGVQFVDSKNDSALVVARNTVLENETEQYVYIANGDTVKKVVVETGIDNGEYIELTSGVKAGDKVVVSGQDYLSDGEKVNIVSKSKGE